MKSKILFLGCNHDEVPYLKNFQEKGFHVVATDVNPNAPGMSLSDSAIICGYDDLEGLERAVSKEGRDDFLMVFTASAQFAQIGASHISKHLGLPYPSLENIKICLDKAAFYPLFQKNGIHIPETHFIRNLSELRNILNKYPKETDFYLKSDFSKNPNHIYKGTSEYLENEDIQWTPDRYFHKNYILQKTFLGEGFRLNIYPGGYELYEFETGRKINEDLPHFKNLKILESLRDLSIKLGMQDWLLKFDILINNGRYVVLDIGMDPPSRMKKYWESKGHNFIDFYTDLYIKSAITTSM